MDSKRFEDDNIYLLQGEKHDDIPRTQPSKIWDKAFIESKWSLLTYKNTRA